MSLPMSYFSVLFSCPDFDSGKLEKDLIGRSQSVFALRPRSHNINSQFIDSCEGSDASGDLVDIFHLHKRKRILSLDPGRRRSSLINQSLLEQLQKINIKKKHNKISASELLERFKKILVIAVDTLINSGKLDSISETYTF